LIYQQSEVIGEVAFWWVSIKTGLDPGFSERGYLFFKNLTDKIIAEKSNS